MERQKRQQIEQCKGAELAAERTDIARWQEQLKLQGDESDYEDEEPAAAAGGARSDAAAMPDHDDYHGKGWKPSSRWVSSSWWPTRMACVLGLLRPSRSL